MSYQNTPEANARREENRKKIEQYFAVERDARRSLYHPDIQMDIPFFRESTLEPKKQEGPLGPPPTPAPGEEELELTLDWQWLPGGEILGTDDPDYFIVENWGTGKQLNCDGTYHTYTNHYFHTFRFKDGLIVDYREINNPLNAIVAVGGSYHFPSVEETLSKARKARKG